MYSTVTLEQAREVGNIKRPIISLFNWVISQLSIVWGGDIEEGKEVQGGARAWLAGSYTCRHNIVVSHWDRALGVTYVDKQEAHISWEHSWFSPPPPRDRETWRSTGWITLCKQRDLHQESGIQRAGNKVTINGVRSAPQSLLWQVPACSVEEYSVPPE